MNYKTTLAMILFVSLAWSLNASVYETSMKIKPIGFEASSDDGNIVDNAFDEDLSTRWSAFGSGQSLTIDLGSQHQVTEMNVAWFKGDLRQSHYQIDLSNEGNNWITVTTGSSSGASSDLEPIAINSLARYIRLIGLGNSSNDWNSITEITISGYQDVVPPTNKDSFGITQFYPTMQGYTDWQSTHWDNSNARTIGTSERDYDDPTGWAHVRGNSPISFDGNGIMEMGGSSPRLYINPYPGYESTGAEQLFNNVEATVYYKRKGTDGANWGGLIMGVRSGPMGHGSAGGDNCDATTYTARFRHDGKWDFEKELKHSKSVSSGYTQLFSSALPADQWIGMKYLAYNIENNTKVKLELWIDDTSNGDVSNGGEWRLLGEYIDDGNWVDPDVSGCSYNGDKIILNGGGVAYLRNTGAESAEYKYFSLREIDITNSNEGDGTIPVEEITPDSVQSSSDDGNVADNVIDNDFSTRWSAQGSGEALTIDLGAHYLVTELQAAWFKGDVRQSHYQLDISDDGLNWLNIIDSSSSGTTLSLESINVNYSGRYFRFTGLGNTSNDWNSITEIKIFGSAE